MLCDGVVFFRSAAKYGGFSVKFQKSTWLGTILCLAALPAMASSERDLSASYDISQSSMSGSKTDVVLNIRVTNYSNRDLFGSTLVIRSRREDSEVLARKLVTPLRARKSAKTSVDVRVSVAELERWLAGRGPDVTLEVSDEEGNIVRRVVDTKFRMYPEED